MLSLFRFVFIISIFSVLALFNPPTNEKTLAFPTAEGFGKYTTGGRGGDVLIVTNLNDEGKGSLREAIETKGKRTIVFQISGNIELKSPLVIRNGDLTIAGHSAPGDGITIQNHPLILRADNLIIRYIRVRLGDLAKKEYDAISGTKLKNVIIDHCSFSWGNDEVASFYDNSNFTLQWSIISEALHNSYHSKGPHGYGGIFGGRKATFHHNLMAHHFARVPRFNGARYHKKPDEEIVDFRNNVLYNWVNYSSYGGELGNHNVINNYYKHGPATQKEHRYRMLRVLEPKGQFYVQGNYIYGESNGSKDNWDGGNWKGPIRGEKLVEAKSRNLFEFEEINMESPQDAFVSVLKKAGASYSRDEIDKRIIEEVRIGKYTYGNKGIIDSQSEVGGWPLLKNEKVAKDSDNDGIPDEWEIKKGLDPNDPNDSRIINKSTGYSYIEEYLNDILKEDESSEVKRESFFNKLLRILGLSH